jgi:hypothetical protein
MYYLAIEELYNDKFHGVNKYMDNKFILMYNISIDEFYNNEHTQLLKQMMKLYINNINVSKINKNILKNMKDYYKENFDVISDSKYFNLHIVKLVNENINETIFNEDNDNIMNDEVLECINMTYYLCILQRKWRNYRNKLYKLAKVRSNPRSIYYRKATGKWLI